MKKMYAEEQVKEIAGGGESALYLHTIGDGGVKVISASSTPVGHFEAWSPVEGVELYKFIVDRVGSCYADTGMGFGIVFSGNLEEIVGSAVSSNIYNITKLI